MKKLITLMLALALCAAWIAAQEVTPEESPPGQVQEPEPATATPTATPTATATATPTATPTVTPILLSVTASEPRTLFSEQAATLSVYGANFSSESRVRLVGYGVLNTTLVNGSTLTAQIPANVPIGAYAIEVSDPLRGTMRSPQTLTISPAPLILPSSTPVPVPTLAPGKPQLVARAFTAFPDVIRPGDSAQLLIEIVNQGNAAAFGISLALDGGKFVPSRGQAAATLDSLAPGAFARLSYSIEAMRDITEGPSSIPMAFSYRNAEGETFSGKAAFSINISAAPQVASVILARSLSTPTEAQAGQRIALTLLFQNNGTSQATQVQVRLVGGSGAPLLPAEEGDTFSLGDLPPGGSVERVFPMVVATDAKSGTLSQPMLITYLQGTERKEVQTALSVRIAPSSVSAPLLLLDSYSTDSEALAPGQTFTLTVTLNNIGAADAAEALVTFGTVSASPPSEGSGGSGGGTGGGSGGSGSGGSGSGGSGGETSTTPSTTFAPLGSGETTYLGTLPQGEQVSLNKEFIVNGTVKSGLYTLPLTVRYQTSDGKTAQANFQLTLLVVVPLRALVTLETPLPYQIFLGDMLDVSWSVQNLGSSDARFEQAEISAQRLDVLGGEQSFVGTLKADRKANLAASFMGVQEGTAEITLTLHYLDDMNRRQTLVETYEVMIMAPPMIEEQPPVDEPIPQETPAPPPERPWVERLLMGLFGLGS